MLKRPEAYPGARFSTAEDWYRKTSPRHDNV